MKIKMILLATALVFSSPALAFNDTEQNNTNKAYGGSGGNAQAKAYGGAGGQGGQGGAGGHAHQGQIQGQAQGQVQGNKNNNSDSINIGGDDTDSDSEVVAISAPSINPTAPCKIPLIVGGGAAGFGFAGGTAVTDTTCEGLEIVRVGLESQNAVMQAAAANLYSKMISDWEGEHYPDPIAPKTVAVGTSTVTVAGKTVPDWCYGNDGFGQSARDRRICNPN